MAQTRMHLKNAGHRDALVNKLWEMVNNNIMTDVTLVSSDGHTIPVHKLVLVTSSDYFKNMQKAGTLDRHLLEFQGVSGSVMQELVRFMYTGSVYATYQSILQVHSTALQLGMNDLVATCNVLIQQQITNPQPTAVRQPVANNAEHGSLQPTGNNAMTDSAGQAYAQVTDEMALSANTTTGTAAGLTGKAEDVNCASGGPDQLEAPPSTNATPCAPCQTVPHHNSVPASSTSPLPASSLTSTHSTRRSMKEDQMESEVLPPTKKRGRPRRQNLTTTSKKKVEEPMTVTETAASTPTTSGLSSRQIESDSEDDLDDVDRDLDYVPEHKVSLTKRSRRKISYEIRPRSGTNSQNFTCNYCGQGFEDAEKMRKHKFWKHSAQRIEFWSLKRALRLSRRSCRCKKINGGYVCKDCGKFFTLKNGYRGHALIVHQRRQRKLPSGVIRPLYYSCHGCDRVFKHLANLKIHASRCGHLGSSWRSILRKLTQTEGRRQKRRKRINPPKTYKKRGVLRRSPRVTSQQEAICPVCRIILPTSDVVVDHIHQDHDIFTFALDQTLREQFAFQCPDCKKLPTNYTSFNSIRTHCQKRHKYDLATTCFHCSARLKTKTALAHHLLSAHRMKSTILKFEPLGKPYIYCSLLNTEADILGSVRCHFCRKLFLDDSDLFGHIRTMHFQFCDYKKVKSNPKRQKEDSYCCANCGFVAFSAADMQSHFVEQHGKVRKQNRREEETMDFFGVYRCREAGCFVELEEEWDLVTHMETDHPQVTYQCSRCPHNTRIYYQHLIHQSKHEGDYVCDLCGKFCRKSNMLKYHRWKEHGIMDEDVTVYRCDVEGCHFECHQKCALTQHQAKHDPDKPFCCQQCGRLLKTQKSLESHISRMHMGIRPYVCEQCGKSFAKPGEIKAHMKTHTESSLSCDHCKFTTMNKYSLISHLLSRHDVQVRQHEKLHQCPYCEYKTMRAKHLQNHVNSHLNKRDFICDLCGKRFISASSLKGHHNWIHAEKAFKCEFCNYKGGALSNLKQHVRVMHTLRGLKPYKCFYCDFRCELSGNCRVHCRSAHKGMEVKWVKVVDFKSELPSKEEAEEIKMQEAIRKKERELQQQEVKALEQQKAKAVDDDNGQLRTLLRTVTNELANIERENQQHTQQQQQQRQLLTQELPDVLSRSLVTTAAPHQQQQQHHHHIQQQQQQLFNDDPYQHQLIYLNDALPTNMPSRTAYYTPANDVQPLYDTPRSLMQQQDLQQVFHNQNLYAPNTASQHNLFTDDGLNH